MPEINIPVEVTPPNQDAEYVERMVAKAEGREVGAPETDTPKFAGKYETVEALEAGYLELQKAFSKKAALAAEPPAEVPATDPAQGEEVPPAATPEEEAAAAALESKGLDIAVFTTEYQEKGQLSTESYEALEKAGLSRDIVDGYIAGQELIASQMVTRVFDTVGGEAEYNNMMLWAKDNLTAEAKTAYQAVLDTNDINKVLLAVKGLQADYTAVRGKTPSLLDGSENAGNAGDVYRSTAEMKADMRDPRYHKDPAFRKHVAEKLGRSNIL